MRTHASRITSIALVSRSPTPPTPLSCRYIKSELDELEREEFFRLKKIQAKKQEAIAKAKEEAKKAEEARLASGQIGAPVTLGAGGSAESFVDLLQPHQDDDLVF